MLLGKIFANGVGLAALTRPLTDAEVESGELGIVAGKVYTSFLRPTNGEDGGVPRYVCRLCYGDKTWKHAKDVLRHIRRDHVGLPEACEEWYAFNYPLIVANAHVYPGHAATEIFIPKERRHAIFASRSSILRSLVAVEEFPK